MHPLNTFITLQELFYFDFGSNDFFFGIELDYFRLDSQRNEPQFRIRPNLWLVVSYGIWSGNEQYAVSKSTVEEIRVNLKSTNCRYSYSLSYFFQSNDNVFYRLLNFLELYNS